MNVRTKLLAPSPTLLGNLKFRWQLLISFLFISLAIIALTDAAYQVSMRGRILQQNTETLDYVVEQTTHNIETRLQYYKRLSLFLTSDQSFLRSVQNEDPAARQTGFQSIQSDFSALMSSNVASLANLMVYSANPNLVKDGKITFGLDERTRREMDGPLRLDADNSIWRPTWKDDRGQKVFSLFSRLPGSDPSVESLLELRIYETDLFGLISKGSPSYRIYVLSDGGGVMSSTDRTLLGKSVGDLSGPERPFVQMKDGVEHRTIGGVLYAAAKGTTDNGWSVIGVVGLSGLIEQELRDVNRSILLFSLVAVVLALLLTLFFSSRLNRRMMLLNKKIQYIRLGEFDRDIVIPGKDEFSMLSKAMDATRTNLKLLVSEIKEEAEQRQKAEMNALRSQINAHFIFNTLSGIRRMVTNREMEGVKEAIDALATFFRISLSDKGDSITVAREIEHLTSYIDLQKRRYDDDILIDLEVREETLGLRTVRLVLQPMVENAIFHGRRSDGRKLRITVRTEIRGDRLAMEVEDDGAGIPPERLADIRRGEIRSERGGGYGIANVERRIRLVAGDPYGIEMDSQEGRGTRMTIWQPLRSDG
ncbi:sensor histidine kinase [Cohnella zeiphila]|uniref:histidine kinase n=1 Tax=Cohnella zeiphila TaxID=2761120 RepID=A0A7X0VYZ6_9BACL|nr:histidine kinase [Cohnella zeiphila]MBB6733463.1 histidine kinase [Cohnella zeiphila]